MLTPVGTKGKRRSGPVNLGVLSQVEEWLAVGRRVDGRVECLSVVGFW